ncbi:MAG: amino acid adenylation domain-containing protein [Desulfobacterales bacterium]|nr:amino acid adenylation domain-containing protein [Desulfobacterales bacterium]
MIDKKNIKNIYELSPMQEGMLFHALYDRDSLAYFEQSYYHITGKVNVRIFEETWNELVRRHDILRTVFVHKNVPQPLQIVLKERKTDFFFKDIRSLTQKEQETCISQYKQNDKQKSFNLSRDVMLRIGVFQSGDTSFDVIMTLHHILMDGWSMSVIQDEYIRIYKALATGTRPVLEPAAGFSEYIRWLKKQDKETAITYWKNYLSNYSQQASLPQSPKEHKEFDAQTFQFELPETTTHKLRQLALRNNVTVNTVVQVIWGILLTQYNSHNDVVFAATVSGRPAEIKNIERMIGLFINAVPVRIRTSPKQTFKELLQKIHNEAAQGKDYHYFSLAEIQAQTVLKQNLLDHILVFENYPTTTSLEESQENLETDFVIDRFEHFDHTNYDLTVQVTPDTELFFFIIYNSMVYDRGIIENLEPHIKSVIDAVIENEELEVENINILLPHEKEKYLKSVTRQKPGKSFQIAAAATFTAEPVGPYIEWWGKQFSLDMEVQFAPYNQVFQELLDPNSLLSANKGANILFIRFEDWIRDTECESEQDYADHIENNYENLISILKEKTSDTPTFIGVFPVSTHVSLPDSLIFYIRALNKRWIKNISKTENVYLLDFTDLAGLYNIEQVFDIQKDKAGHLPFSDEYYAATGSAVARKLIAWKKPLFKVIALDCDNTLWKGICGEDGTLGVEVQGGYAALQQFMTDKYNEGFLLVLCSKNNENDVWEVFDNNPQMILKKEHIVGNRINWNAKSENLREIADELNLSLNSFIFIDDSPMECAEVSTRCPEVLTLQLPENPDLIPIFLSHAWAFDKLIVTDEDRKRSEMYQAEKKRKELKQDNQSLNDFLGSLGLKMYMGQVQDYQVERVSQLTQRTNQFNLTTVRRTEEQINALANQPHVSCWTVEVEDRFGDYGLVGVVIGEKQDRILKIDTFLLSCRVLGRGVENAILTGLKNNFSNNGITVIKADYIPTEKNRPALEFLEKNWRMEEKTDTKTLFQIDIDQIPEKIGHIDLKLESRKLKVETGKLKLEACTQPAIGNPAAIGSQQSATINQQTTSKFPVSGFQFPVSSFKPHYLPLSNCSPAALLELPVHEAQERAVSTEFVAPQDEDQEKMASIWKEILSLDSIGIDDNYFELGGHSLMATRIVSRIYKAFETEISLKEFFDNPDIRRLTQAVDRKTGTDSMGFADIGVLPEAEHYEVSHSQRRFWILDRMEDNFIAYNLSAGYRLEGNFDPDIFSRAFKTVLNRHESLRTTFLTVEGEPRQKIHDSSIFEIEIEDLRGKENNEEMAREYAKKEAAIKFDLEKGPLLRVKLLRLSENAFILLLNIHHIICDGWSFSVLSNELLRLHRTFAQGRDITLNPLRIQYKDFAAWQNRFLAHDNIKAHQDYWHKKLSGQLPVLNLSTDFPRPGAQTYNGNIVSHVINPELTAGLKKYCAENGASLFMGLLAAAKVLLSRYTGQEDIIIGSPVAGRNHADTEDQIGFYVNTLALRDSVKGSDRFENLLADVKKTTIQAYDHQLYPFDRLVEELDIQRDVSRAPIFDVMLVLQNNEASEPELTDFEISNFEYETVSSQFDLTMIFTEDDKNLFFDMNYNTDLFRKDTIERMGTHFEEIVKSILEHENQTIDNLNILSQSEKKQILADFNDTQADYPKEKTIIDLFEEQAEKTPDNIALIFEDKSFTYRELDEAANKVAIFLKDNYRIKPDDLAGVIAERNEHLIVILLGILKSGGAYLPIDPAYPQQRIDYMIKDSGCKVLLETGNWKLETGNEHIYELGNSPLEGGQGGVFRGDDRISEYGQHPPGPQGGNFHRLPQVAETGNLAYVIYTSGSTGEPKGVMIEHGGFVNMITAQIKGFGITESDRVLQFASPSFDASLSEIFMALLKGAALVLIRKKTIEETESFLKYIQEKNVSAITFPPVYLNMLNKHPMPTVKTIITAGEPAIKEDVAFYSKNKNYFNAYGPTETSVCTSFYKVPHFSLPTSHFSLLTSHFSLPIGNPISNSSVFILDKALNPVPVGVPGEICFSGPGLARGYLNKPELTSEKFVYWQRPGNQEKQRMYRIGDLGRWLPDGNIEFLGRKDDQVKVRGHRIELGEIENRLKQHPLIEDALVMAIESPENTKELAAYVITKSEINIGELRSFTGEALPSYMIPAFFVLLEKFPLTVNGKIDKKTLPDPFDSDRFTDTDYTAPKNEIESVLEEVWKKLFNKEKISVHENFFAFGGDSIKAIRMVSHLQKQGLNVRAGDIFQYPTIAQLSKKLFKISDIGKQETVSGAIPLTAITSWFFKEFTFDKHHFNHASMLFSKKRLDERALQEVFAKLQEHHDALRMKFEIQGSKLVQEICGHDYPLSFQTTDLTHSDDPFSELEQQAEILQSTLDLKNGPLMKTVLFRLNDGDRLLVVIHHLAVDGVSWRILLEDIVSGYEQYISGNPVKFSLKTDSFKKWAENIQTYSTSDSLLGQKEYWHTLESAGDIPDLPCDLSCDDDSEYALMKHVSAGNFILSPSETEQLIKAAHFYEAGIDEILLAALAYAMKKWHGTSKTLITLEGHGREDIAEGIDVSRTVGWFTSTYPVILDSPDSSDVKLRIRTIKSLVRNVPGRGMGYGILKYITPTEHKKELKFNLKPRISFNYLGQYDEDISTGFFEISKDSHGHTVSPNAKIIHDLDINAIIAEKKLQLYLAYNNKRYSAETVERILNFKKRFCLELL